MLKNKLTVFNFRYGQIIKTGTVLILGMYFAFLNLMFWSGPKNQYFCYQRPDMVQAMQKVAYQEQRQIDQKLAEIESSKKVTIEKIKTASIRMILQPLIVAEK